ncbi:hypothetical protein Glove_171g3 [Diversispora epigaea]|uniref:Uncharacterized protein n=1 Tax=Diversispora epigaea TaxID=1348612 RepID=A0A397IPE3_9GLOM|nr:hypothetical protein Glove_171g3 [Diversispora epigaea]
MLPDFISFSENQKLKKEITELKRQNSQMEIDFEEKLEKSQENINQMKEEIDFLANINQQFGVENDQLIKNLDRFQKYRVFGNDSEEDTESDDEKNEKDARVNNSNEMKTIIKIINSKFSLNYDQTFTSANNCEIRRKLIPELQKSLAPKFRSSVTQLTKWLNSIHKSRRATARMPAKELFKKNDPNIIDYDKESLLRMLADRAFHSPKMFDTDEEDRSKTVVNVYDLSWRSAEVSIYF